MENVALKGWWRLSRLQWLLIGTLLLLGLYGFLGTAYLRERLAADQLKEERIALERVTSAGAPKGRVAEAEERLQAVRRTLTPPDVMETDVFKMLHSLASQSDVEIVSLEKKSEVAQQNMGRTRVRSMSFAMTITGSPDAVWEFVRKLEGKETPISALTLQRVSVVFQGTSTAAVDFVIYGLPTGSPI